MLGQLKLVQGGKGHAERENLYGLSVLRTDVDPEGWFGEMRLARAGKSLRTGGARRVLLPPDFEFYDMLKRYGLIPVECSPLLRANSAALAMKALERHCWKPERAAVALRGHRADRDMRQAAISLCKYVRNIIISAPAGGAELSMWLRQEFGVPVLPPEEQGEVALHFEPYQQEDGTVLELYGGHPKLDGLRIEAPNLAQGDRSDLPLLSTLWENRKLGVQDLNIT